MLAIRPSIIASALLHVDAFEKRSGAPQVSAPERTLLELLSEIGVRQPLQDARELLENAYSCVLTCCVNCFNAVRASDRAVVLAV